MIVFVPLNFVQCVMERLCSFDVWLLMFSLCC
jgi:hypothetical protein